MKKLVGIYYKIWVDCILRLRSQKQNKDTWVGKSLFMMSIAMTLNFILLMAFLQRHVLGCYFYKLDIPSMSDRYNDVLSIFVLFALPVVVVNWLLIFRKKRLKKLVKKYRYSYCNGKLVGTYLLISLFLPVVLLVIYIITTQEVTFWDFFDFSGKYKKH